MVNHLAVFIVKIGVHDLRRRQSQADCFAGNRHVVRRDAFEVNARLDDAVREQEHAVFAIPFHIFKNDDFFEHVFDGDQIRKRLDLLDHRCGVFHVQAGA